MCDVCDVCDVCILCDVCNVCICLGDVAAVMVAARPGEPTERFRFHRALEPPPPLHISY